jgi:hypothetical protein
VCDIFHFSKLVDELAIAHYHNHKMARKVEENIPKNLKLNMHKIKNLIEIDAAQLNLYCAVLVFSELLVFSTEFDGNFSNTGAALN